jgi:hypothetical protein
MLIKYGNNFETHAVMPLLPLPLAMLLLGVDVGVIWLLCDDAYVVYSLWCVLVVLAILN